MKKIILVLLLFFGILGYAFFEIKSMKEELQAIKFLQCMELIDERTTREYAKLETETLKEPVPQSDDVLERINMLRQHLFYSPSSDWICDVVTAAELEIIELRSALKMSSETVKDMPQ